MSDSIRAELLIMRKRTSTWILLGLWATLALVFAYAVPYATFLNGSAPDALSDVLPGNLVESLMGGFPFFGGVLALMLGVLTFGSDYGWGTLKTLFMQRPGRMRVFAAKLVALAAAVAAMVLVVYVFGVLASYTIAIVEGADLAPPSAWLVIRGLAAGWLILAVWAAFGAVLAVVSRGTSLAVGIGILYALVIEGLLSALATQVNVLDRLVEFFVRANGYSLVVALGVTSDDARDNGPGSFRGPFVDGEQALLVLGVYGAFFLLVAGWLLRRRDVA
jgi:ABC-2 type transport system permease protein